MNSNKLTTPTNKYNKNQPKSQHTNVTLRSNSQYNGESKHNNKKQQRTKAKKENTEHSNLTSQRSFIQNTRAPFTQINYDQSNKINHHQQLQTISLRENNRQLQNRVNLQAKELRELKESLQFIKQSIAIDNNYEKVSPIDSKNNKLQKIVQEKSGQIQNLKNQIAKLHQINSINQQQFSMNNSMVEDSKVSIRQQYARLYQNYAPQPQKQTKERPCKSCQKYEQEIEQMRLKYGDELRKLQSQIASFRQKQILFEVFQMQLRNKNQCIDYLRYELQRFEINSEHLLNIVNTLQNRLAHQQGRYNPNQIEKPLCSYNLRQ